MAAVISWLTPSRRAPFLVCGLLLASTSGAGAEDRGQRVVAGVDAIGLGLDMIHSGISHGELDALREDLDGLARYVPAGKKTRVSVTFRKVRRADGTPMLAFHEGFQPADEASLRPRDGSRERVTLTVFGTGEAVNQGAPAYPIVEEVLENTRAVNPWEGKEGLPGSNLRAHHAGSHLGGQELSRWRESRERWEAERSAPVTAGTPVSEAPPEVRVEYLGDVMPWSPPAQPGGIALDPDLVVPVDPEACERIATRRGDVVLVTRDGELVLDGLRPGVLATVLRTVAMGQVPFITIGTQPSDRPGQAKVTVAPALAGTYEGLILYRADIRFKAIFADFPFGEDFSLNAGPGTVGAAYPGSGGDSTRLWISAADIVLERDGDRLVTLEHGMRILGETTLFGLPTPDLELDAYTRSLTEQWETLARKVPEFRVVQEMALATGLAFHVRRHGIEIDPGLMAWPSLEVPVPDHAPVLASLGEEPRLTGGVSLTPTESGREAGRMLMHTLASLLHRRGERDGSRDGSRLGTRVLLGLAVLVPLVLIIGPALLGWLWARWRLNDGSGGAIPSPGRMILLWALAVGLHLALTMIMWGLVHDPRLSAFDQEFLCLLGTVVAFPLILFWLLRSDDGPFARLDRERTRHGPTRLAFLVLAGTGPLASAVLGTGLALVTLLASSAVPSRELETVLSIQANAQSMLERAFLCAVPDSDNPLGRRVLPMPRSFLLSVQGRFTLEPPDEKAPPPDVLSGPTPGDPLFPFENLQRIRWPTGRRPPADRTQYSPDGRPPF